MICGVGVLYNFIALFNKKGVNLKLLIGAIGIIIAFYNISLIIVNTLNW